MARQNLEALLQKLEAKQQELESIKKSIEEIKRKKAEKLVDIIDDLSQRSGMSFDDVVEAIRGLEPKDLKGSGSVLSQSEKETKAEEPEINASSVENGLSRMSKDDIYNLD